MLCPLSLAMLTLEGSWSLVTTRAGMRPSMPNVLQRIVDGRYNYVWEVAK